MAVPEAAEAAAPKKVVDPDFEPERVEMYNMSSAMGVKFAEVATEFTERIKQLGPNPVKREGVSPHAAAREALGGVAMPDEAERPAAATVEEGHAE